MGFSVLTSALVLNAPLQSCSSSRCVSRSATSSIQMINLFGNTDESKKTREALSYRSARPGDRKVTFRKPPSATAGLELGLKFKESFMKAVYIDKIIPGTEAARLEKEGKIKVGDEVTMVSATFGDEMWSARNVGKYRLEKSIAVRQGMQISFVFENSNDKSMKAREAEVKRQQAEKDKTTRLQKQLAQEVEQEKKKGSFFGGFFRDGQSQLALCVGSRLV